LLHNLDLLLQTLPFGEERTAVYKLRQAVYNEKNTKKFINNPVFNQVEVKNTLKSSISDWTQSSENYQKAYKNLQLDWENLLIENYISIQKTAEIEQFQRGLLLSSHDLWSQIPEFRKKNAVDFRKSEVQTALSLFQYIARSAAKTSPFSHFTAVSIQEIDKLGFEKESFFDSEKSIITPNVALLEAIYELLLHYPVFYQNIKLKLNPCVVAKAEVYKFIYFDGEQESFQKLEADGVIDLVITSFLVQRTQTYKDLYSLLENEVEAEATFLTKFITDLTEIGLLEWDFPEKGLSPSWCGTLMNFLGFLPAEPIIVETAALLQWYRTTARTFAWQSVSAAQQILLETKQKTEEYFLQFEGKAPALKTEHYFYEDVITEVSTEIKAEELQDCVQDLRNFISEKKLLGTATFEPSEEQKLIFNFLKHRKTKKVDVLTVAEEYLVWKQKNTSRNGENIEIKPVLPNKIGALIQFFRNENGQLSGVVNAMYGNAGRMFARWMPYNDLLNANVQKWLTSEENQVKRDHSLVSNSNLGATNANFHPLQKVDFHLDTFGAKCRGGENNRFPVGNLSLTIDKKNAIISEKTTEKRLLLSDWGLESLGTKTPFNQFLIRCMTPNVSVNSLVGEIADDWRDIGTGIKFRNRKSVNNFVLLRATWLFEASVWTKWLANNNNYFDLFLKLTNLKNTLNIPRFVFFQIGTSKPQYLDFNSPINLILFKKTLKAGAGNLQIMEMLPTPAQALVYNKGTVVSEFVCEFST
jgi:Lantibiotic dehydratase, N terminus